MKDVVKLIEKQDIHDYLIDHVWTTPEFKRNYQERGIVWKISDDFARLPRFFFTASDPAMETSHFSTWWGGMQRRTYDSPYIHDLYELHELHHAAYMPFMPGLSFESFSGKMVDSELDASVMSEIRIYFEMPGLRDKSFPYEIYADRFLNDPAMQAEWQEAPEMLAAKLRLKRGNVMTSERPKDMTEKWIHNFAQQNNVWNAIWYHRYDMVETAMAKLESEVRTLGRAKAFDNFYDWLIGEKICKNGDIPFPDEARAFAGIYQFTKSVYEEDHRLGKNTAAPMPDKKTAPSP